MAAGFSCLFIFSACVNSEKEVSDLLDKKIGVDEATNVQGYMSNTGKMKARMRAPSMLRYQDSTARTEFPKGIHVDFFNDSTKIENQMDARFAEYYEMKAQIFLKDSVRVFNNINDTLFCQELWWDQTKQLFYTDKPVRVHRPDMIMYGVGLSAPQDFKTFEMYKITNSVLRVSDVSSQDTVRRTQDSVVVEPAPVVTPVQKAPEKTKGTPPRSQLPFQQSDYNKQPTTPVQFPKPKKKDSTKNMGGL
jgi:LPS export ABC transporter protein LptC